jgi:hypothetical protein
MQTFLPYPDFVECAKTLDWKRLGKQRVEAKQINKALRGEYSRGWVNHPAKKMWEGYEVALCEYGIAMCKEWRERGYADACLVYFWEERLYWESIRSPRDVHWLNDDSFHASHRSNLLRKDLSYYSKYGWAEPDNLPYIWPSGYRG